MAAPEDAVAIADIYLPYVRDTAVSFETVSLYLDSSIRRRGDGRRIYTALLNPLGAQRYINAYAGIALPNPASVGLHEALGFNPVGAFRDVGFKNDTWWDVGWWHRRLAEPPVRPREPRSWSELPTDAINSALDV